MKIGDFARQTETPIDTLRYYDQIGLLVPSRNKGIRCYDEHDLTTMQMIQALKAMHHTLDEIKAMVHLDQAIDQSIQTRCDCTQDINKMADILDAKYEELKKQEIALKKAKEQINHIRDKIKNYRYAEDQS